LTFVACKVLGYSLRRERQLLPLLPQMIRYLAILFWQIVLANVQVMRLLLRPKHLHLQPTIARFTPQLHSPMTRLALANSITLTPGTITVAVEDGVFVVQALDESFAAGLDESVFVRELTEMEAKFRAR
jgi:multicomponent Na+:H+ antiporter subunit E